MSQYSKKNELNSNIPHFSDLQTKTIHLEAMLSSSISDMELPPF